MRPSSLDCPLCRRCSVQRLSEALFVYRVEETEGERGPWKVSTLAYYHSLEDEAGREFVAYQWHPVNRAASTSRTSTLAQASARALVVSIMHLQDRL
jgi:hypothetical protein